MKLLDYLSRRHRVEIILLGYALTLVIGWADFVTGPVVALMLFYLIPLFMVAWYAGRWHGLCLALVSGLLWYAVKVKLHDPRYTNNQLALFWNVIMRLGVFAVASLLTSEVAERKRVELALRQTQQGLELRAQELARSEAALRQQTGILQSILNSMGDGVMVADDQAKILLFNPTAERLVRTGLGDITPEQWIRQQSAFLPSNLTTFPTSEHPLLRAIRGEKIDGAEMLLHRPGSTDDLWLNTTARPLVDDHGKLHGGVVVFSDITARKLLEKQIAEISDREQARIGQDLHDGVCQQLVSTAFAAELLREKLSLQHRPETVQAEKIAEMVNDAISQSRHLARGLYPVRLEVDGLSSALEEMAANLQSRTGVRCRFACDEPVLIHDETAGSNLYRIAQEAANNAVKHGHCKNISIGLGAVEDEVTLTIKDDGIGFHDSPAPGAGMGLHIMNYRARMIGATLDIRRSAAGGTIVICSFHNENLLHKFHVKTSQV